MRNPEKLAFAIASGLAISCGAILAISLRLYFWVPDAKAHALVTR